MEPVQSFENEHEAFAASRVSQYVFVPTKDSYFTALDQHADTVEGDVKPPLVLVGNEGSGKSALLANWVSKRREEHKYRDEFLFQHYVGCTTPSLQLAHTLFRLETALKDFFQLREMKVPETEEELRWSLNRFLASAAKKHFPARIVIILDGVHRLKPEGAPEGALYWLPTDLPPCVRFIVSTVEYERVNRFAPQDLQQHRTFVELVRRRCPLLRIEPLVPPTRTEIIKEFVAFTTDKLGSIEFTESQHYKIITAPATSQPMYLRSLLQSVRIASTLTEMSMDHLLEAFLSCTSAHDLIDRSLNICSKAIFPKSDHVDLDNSRAEMLGKVLAMVYASRNGLAVKEILGLVKMLMHIQLDEEVTSRLFSVLNELTMVVSNMHSFSHEVYREVVYSKYICSHDALIRWHNFLARFFGQLEPCDRKLVALPYHLEEAGAWSKVKNCLTEIEMFQLWWTPEFKPDFIKFWASLTRQSPKTIEQPPPVQGSIIQHRSNVQKKNRKTGAITSSSSMSNLSATGGSSGLNSSQSLEGSLGFTAPPTTAGTTGTNEGFATNDFEHPKLSKRPSYDIVEEYVKSLDEYRTLKHPSDETVANIILEIADFLLEFALIGHEATADVPSSVHPHIPSTDWNDIGVPYLSTDEEGRSLLNYPEIFTLLSNKQKSMDTADAGVGNEAPVKAIDDIQTCTAYYFHRWMWIQFPFIALGNCDKRYQQGIVHKNEGDMLTGQSSSAVKNAIAQLDSTDNVSITSSVKHFRMLNSGPMSKSLSADSFKLPKLKFIKKAARTLRRTVDDGSGLGGEEKLAQRMELLQDEIQSLKEEFNFISQMKSSLEKRLIEHETQFLELKACEESVNHNNSELEEAEQRDLDHQKKQNQVHLINQNLRNLLSMCERHPGNCPALIRDLQKKINEDNFLIGEIRKRLLEQQYERQAQLASVKNMKALIKQGGKLHIKILKLRYQMRNNISIATSLDEKRLKEAKSILNGSGRAKSSRGGGNRGKDGGSTSSSAFKRDDIDPAVLAEQNWSAKWSIISSRTGIVEPEIFFERLANGGALEEQINILKKNSEARLEAAKREVVLVEKELEDVRYEASVAGVQSNKEQQKGLADKQFDLRHIKEKAEAAEQLQQKVISGLGHVADMLGVAPTEDETPVTDLLRDIEAVLDTLMDEREKQLQQQGQGQQQSQSTLDSHSRSLVGRDNTATLAPETLHRSPELDFVIAKYEEPKARLPKQLPSRPRDPKPAPGEDEPDTSALGDDDEDDEGTWNRSFVKAQSQRVVKSELKKAMKQAKLAETGEITGN